MKSDCKFVQPEPLWVINPMVLKYSKRYILGLDHAAIRLFFRLCSMRIYVDGFIDDSVEGMTIYNKRIYKITDVSERDSVLLVSTITTEHQLTIAVCDNPVIINPAIINSDVYVYGAGYIGRKVLECLGEIGVDVKGFIDSDNTKINSTILDKVVYKRDILESMNEGVSIIEAGKYYREIDSIVYELNKTVHRFFCSSKYEWFDNAIWVDGDVLFEGVKFFDGEFCKKKIYLCGEDYDLVHKYREIFKILDFKDVQIAKWANEVSDQNVCCIEDVLLENNCIVVFCEPVSNENLERLYDLGLQRGKDFCDIRCNIWEKYQGIQMLDVNLAYTREMSGSCYPGIAVFGNNREEDYKIAILGGSTSTSGYFWFRSWPEILYEKYCGNSVTVINGAVEGYTSAQELMKLMRDIVCFKPDLVIVYDGNNDVVRNEKLNIFEIPYMKTIVEHASEKMDIQEKKQDIFCGIPPKEDVVDVWLKNIEYMSAVCKLNNIDFVSFMQPMLLTKTTMCSKGEEVVKRKWDFILSLYGGKSTSQTREFRKRATDICSRHDYIYDLSHIFDDKDVYMDHCHVFENGNEIIADEIYKVIRNYVKKW